MINLEFTDSMVKMQAGVKMVARNMLRPIARKYDQEEHVYPKELDVFRGAPLFSRSKKNKNGDKKQETPKGTGPNLGQIISVEAMCWGDCGLLMSIDRKSVV